jgi:hypothetical protein
MNFIQVFITLAPPRRDDVLSSLASATLTSATPSLTSFISLDAAVTSFDPVGAFSCLTPCISHYQKLLKRATNDKQTLEPNLSS